MLLRSINGAAESGHWLKNLYQTHLVQVSGNLVLRKTSSLCKKFVLYILYDRMLLDITVSFFTYVFLEPWNLDFQTRQAQNKSMFPYTIELPLIENRLLHSAICVRFCFPGRIQRHMNTQSDNNERYTPFIILSEASLSAFPFI